MTILLKNAKIYDGTAAPPFQGDLLLKDDRIARVAPRIDAAADKIYDLQGQSVAPGFIDGHSHNDWFAIRPNCLPCFEPFIRQGITSFVTGNCGLSAIAAGCSATGDRPPAFTRMPKACLKPSMETCPAISRCWPAIAAPGPALRAVKTAN